MGMGRLIFAGVVVGLTLIAFAIVAVPISAPTKAYGVITSITVRKVDGRSQSDAVVRLGGADAHVRLHGGQCRAGDRILVHSQKTLIGQRHRAGREGCAG